MKRLLLGTAAALFLSAPAHAATFTLDSYSVTLQNVDPGLVVSAAPTVPYAGDLSFDLNVVGQSYTTQLFVLGTTEDALNLDDLAQKPINVDFTFSSPNVAIAASNGLTGAAWFLANFGYVTWDNPAILNFGTTGQLGIWLEDVAFGLPGAAGVDVTFQLLQQDVPVVPEPATMVLFGTGLAAGAARLRRRFKK